jgi:hypothetical protein
MDEHRFDEIVKRAGTSRRPLVGGLLGGLAAAVGCGLTDGLFAPLRSQGAAAKPQSPKGKCLAGQIKCKGKCVSCSDPNTCTCTGCTNTCTGGMMPNATTCLCECPSGTTECAATTGGATCCSDAIQYCGHYNGVVGCLYKVCNEPGPGICTGGGGTCAGDPNDPTVSCACGQTADGGGACLDASECQTGEPCETNATCPEGTVCVVTGTGQKATGPNRCVRVCPLSPV